MERTSATAAREELPPCFALHFLFEFIPFRFLFDKAWTIAESGLPHAAPRSANAILALDFPLELPAFGFDLHFAGTTPKVFLHLTAPPALAIARTHIVIGMGCRLTQQNGCYEQGQMHSVWTHGEKVRRGNV